MPVSFPFIAALVLLLTSVAWAIVTREVSALLFAVWAADVLFIFGKWA